MRRSRFILALLLAAYFCAAFVAQAAGIVMPAVGCGNLEMQSLEPLPVKPPQHRIDIKKHVIPQKASALQQVAVEAQEWPPAQYEHIRIPSSGTSSVYHSPLTTSSAERGPPTG